MKTVCFLNGHLILREHKTGVHYFHEIVTRKIAQLDKSYRISVAFFDHDGEHTSLMRKTNNKWVEEYSRICRRAPRILSYLLPIEMFFGKNDVYFCDGLFPHTFFKSKKICLVHDLMVKIYPQNYSILKRIYLELFFSKLKKADAIVCVSETTKKDIIRFYGVDPEKIVVCYNGIDEKQGYPSTLKLDDNSIDVTKNYLLYVGDMRKNKNLINTVKGFLMNVERYNNNDLYFYIAGKKNGEFESIKKIVESSPYGNQVKFLGYISDGDKMKLYLSAKAIVLLSYYEGFGMPIIEGIQYGKPVITSNCSSMKEIGEGIVLLADPNSPEDICETIHKIQSGEYEIDAEQYENALKKYTFDNVAQTINHIIEEVIS